MAFHAIFCDFFMVSAGSIDDSCRVCQVGRYRIHNNKTIPRPTDDALRYAPRNTSNFLMYTEVRKSSSRLQCRRCPYPEVCLFVSSTRLR